MPELHNVPLDAAAWGWKPGDVAPSEFHGRPCVTFGESVNLLASLGGVELTDGVIEIDMALSGERGFHGLAWRVLDDDNYESFYVRPHQVRNPDSVQYNPVFNGVASWQLYHDDGFWAAVDFPMREWFTVRVVFAGARAEAFVGDMAVPALQATELKMPVVAGQIAIQIGGPGLMVARFAYAETPAVFVGAAPVPVAPMPGIVPAWSVSDTFAEFEPAPVVLGQSALADRTWTRLVAEASGLVNLAIANGVSEGRNTAWARTSLRADRARVVPMALGFSDRAVVYLNGHPLFAGDETYRSRDYRFLGSIGWYDTIYLPLVAGDNDLSVAVSESGGGWGIQARFDSLDGLVLGDPVIQ